MNRVRPIETNAASDANTSFTHIWRIRKYHAHRFGQPCRILARGKMNSVLIEFADGWRTVTSRNFIRAIAAEEARVQARV